MSAPWIVLGVLGLALLMTVHEAGHYFAARYFGMRVTTFSIGFGPSLWKYQPPGSPTTFQIALIPFLAYVKIAGINPFEEIEPGDKGSYANASLRGRIVTIAAGPLVNYFFASILFFCGVLIAGKTEIDMQSMRVNVSAQGPAAHAGLKAGDKVTSVNGKPVATWDAMKAEVGAHPGEKIDLGIERDGAAQHVYPTPGSDGPMKGLIQIGPFAEVRKVGLKEASIFAVVAPAGVVRDTLTTLAKMVTGREKPQFMAPHELVGDLAQTFAISPGDGLKFLGAISAYLAAFNLLPLPALDGGRIVFLLYELVARRRPDAKTEAKVHAVGIVVFLTFTMVLTISHIFRP